MPRVIGALVALALASCAEDWNSDDARAVDSTLVLSDGQRIETRLGATPRVYRTLSDGSCAPSVLLSFGGIWAHPSGSVSFPGEHLTVGATATGTDDDGDLWFADGGRSYRLAVDTVTLTERTRDLVALEATGDLCWTSGGQHDVEDCAAGTLEVQLHATDALAALPPPACVVGTAGASFGDLCEVERLEPVDCPE